MLFCATRSRTSAFASVGITLSLASASFASTEQQLTVTSGPSTALIDVGLPVRIHGAFPGARVLVRATLIDDHDLQWASEATFDAGADGSVDVARTASVDGTYTGVSAHSLWCSMLPVSRSELASYIEELPTNPDPATSPALGARSEYSISVSATSRGEAATVTVMRAFKAPSVTQREVREGVLRGRLFLPPGRPTGKPAVLVLGGSGGGLMETPAMLFASHGYPALALAYFAYSDLQKALLNIPLELFGEGATWLKKATDGSPVVIWGVSRGSEAAMLTAAHYPGLVSGIIALDPAPVAHRGFGPGSGPYDAAWTFAGKGVPFVHLPEHEAQRYRNAAEAEGKAAPGFEGTAYFLVTWNDPSFALSAGIPVENISSPILLIAGASDTMWPSWVGAKQIRDRMAAHGRGGLVEVHTYPGAGHTVSLVGTGNAMSSFKLHPITKSFVSLGGLPVENCEASFDAWRQELRFLRTKVKLGPAAGARHSAPPIADH